MNNLTIAGVVRDLSHLRAFIVAVPKKGRDGADLRVEVSFGSHAISVGCEPGDANMVDENGKPRLFCEERYAFSSGLPTMTRKMIEQNYFCWESQDRNRATNYAVVDLPPGPVNKLPDGDHEIIFFYLYPADEDVVDVKFVVTSCHTRPMVFGQITRRYNAHVLLRKCLYERKRIP